MSETAPVKNAVLCLTAPAFVLLACCAFAPAAASAEDLQVNVATAWVEEYAALAMNAAGEVVIVWHSEMAEGDSFGTIQGRRYSADGAQQGEQIRINTDTLEDERNPAVAIDSAGEFAVVWNRYIGFDGITVEYQRFAADGTKDGEQQMVSFREDVWAGAPAVAMDGEGNAVVVWDETPDLDDYTISARRFDAKLGPLDERIGVSSAKGSPFDYHWGPSVATTTSGDRFVVAWRARIPNDPNGYEILARRFAGDGAALGEPFQVNTLAAGDQSNPVVAVDAAGNFAIAWHSDGSLGSDASGLSVQVRRFGSDGTAFGPEVQVNTYTEQDQRRPSITMTPTGEFAVAWASQGSPTQGAKAESLHLQRFLADGTVAGQPIEVNTTPGVVPFLPRIGLDAEGNFVAAWSILGSLGDDPNRPAVRSRATGWNQLYGDGFESGTVGNWSSSQP